MNNAQIDGYYIDIVMPTYELIEYSNIHSKYQEVYGNIIEMKQL